jgi:hypothetical protein
LRVPDVIADVFEEGLDVLSRMAAEHLLAVPTGLRRRRGSWGQSLMPAI